MSVEHSRRCAIATTLLCRFYISEVDTRHASRLFTIQGELEDGTDISGSSGERRWAASVCQHLFILQHRSWLSDLTEGVQYGLVDATSFQNSLPLCVVTLVIQ